MKSNKLYFLLTFAFLVALYLPGLPDSHYVTDDLSLVNLPVFQGNFSYQTLKTIFTPGWHIDFYPIRDLSYALDIFLLKASPVITNGFIFRFHNLLLLFISSFLFYSILFKLTQNNTLSLGLALTWLMHPIHAESIMWIAARKDVLALMFALASVYFYLTEKLWASFFLFVFSLLSKSSFGLLSVILFLNEFKRKKFKQSPTVYLMILASLASSSYQGWFYSNIHDLRMNYDFQKRIMLSLTALGREFVGIFNPSVNAIDNDNWGTWLDLNIEFLKWGLLFWVLLLVGTLYFLVKRSHSALLLILCGVLLYIPTSGLLFPHRQFYSVRYFEPIFLVLILCLAFLLNKFKFYKQIVYTLFLACLFLSFFESKYWNDNITAETKGLLLTPKNSSLMSIRAASLLNNINSSNISQFKNEINYLMTELNRICGAHDQINITRNGDLCFNYWMLHAPNESHEILLKFSKANSDESFLRRKLLYEIKEIASNPSLALINNETIISLNNQIDNQRFLMIKEDYRILVLNYYCQTKQKIKYNEFKLFLDVNKLIDASQLSLCVF